KSHGQHLEDWLQQTGPAIARRLLVASMACMVVWGLQADESAEAGEFKTLLVRLSGRQTKRTRPHTAPAMLKGLWTLLSMMSVLQDTNLELLQQLAHRFLPEILLDTGEVIPAKSIELCRYQCSGGEGQRRAHCEPSTGAQGRRS